MAHRWRATAVLIMLSALRSSRAFLAVAPRGVGRRLSAVGGQNFPVRGIAAAVADARSSAAAGSCLRARHGEAGAGGSAAEGPGGRRGLLTSAPRLSAVEAVNAASRTSSTTLEQVKIRQSGDSPECVRLPPCQAASHTYAPLQRYTAAGKGSSLWWHAQKGFHQDGSLAVSKQVVEHTQGFDCVVSLEILRCSVQICWSPVSAPVLPRES